MNKILKKNLKNIAIILIMAIFFILDRYLKHLALTDFADRSIALIKPWFNFSLSKNYFIAFSLPLGGMILNILITLIILTLITYIFYLILNNNKNNWLILPLTLILFGAISNFTDRLNFGYVVDYFDCQYFTIFNIADMMISAGVIYILFISWKYKKYVSL